jgi:molybdenum cofactor synthesis domain-containing protein
MIIESLNISDQKAGVKTPVEEVLVTQTGLQHDAHADQPHRQVSILGRNSISRFEKMLGRRIAPGEFAENITVNHFDVQMVGPLDVFKSGHVVLEVSQIGKKCHGADCMIFQQTGDCAMSKEGIFCRVLEGGKLKSGDNFEHHPKVFQALVITLSDRCAAGTATDASGPAVIEKLKSLMAQHNRRCEIQHVIIPDEPTQLDTVMKRAFQSNTDIIITTGSTGIGPRDIAPETIQPLLDKEIPGIMELVRMKYGMEKPGALLSRAVAGTKNKSLVFAIPGSPRAVAEYMDEINKVVFHCFNMLYAIDNH